MNIKHYFFAAFLTGITASAAVAVDENTTTEEQMARTILTVNGQEMTVGHLVAYRDTRQGLPLPEDPMQAQDVLINELLSSMLLAQEAEKRELDKNVAVLAALEIARQQTLRQAALGALLAEEEIPEEAIKANYDEQYKTEEVTEYKARHILLEDEAAASEIIKQLDSGADFEELAKEKSTGPSGPNGGDLGWFSLDRMVEPFGEAVAAMESGTHSSAPVQTEFGWHVIKLEETRSAQSEPPDYAMLKPQIEQQLKIEAVRGYLEELQNKATINISDKAGVEEAR